MLVRAYYCYGDGWDFVDDGADAVDIPEELIDRYIAAQKQLNKIEEEVTDAVDAYKRSKKTSEVEFKRILKANAKKMTEKYK